MRNLYYFRRGGELYVLEVEFGIRCRWIKNQHTTNVEWMYNSFSVFQNEKQVIEAGYQRYWTVSDIKQCIASDD